LLKLSLVFVALESWMGIRSRPGVRFLTTRAHWTQILFTSSRFRTDGRVDRSGGYSLWSEMSAPVFALYRLFRRETGIQEKEKSECNDHHHEFH
jgi:hypothetical protein